MIPWTLAGLGMVLSSHSLCSALLSAFHPSVLLPPDCCLYTVFIEPFFSDVLDETLISLSVLTIHPQLILLYISGHFSL